MGANKMLRERMNYPTFCVKNEKKFQHVVYQGNYLLFTKFYYFRNNLSDRNSLSDSQLNLVMKYPVQGWFDPLWHGQLN